MKFGYRESCLSHDTGPRHPERPDRLRVIRHRLSREHGVEYVAPDAADVEAVTSVHDGEYVEQVREFCASGGGQWDGDTVAVEETWEAALASAGLAIWAAREALDGATGRETPFALGRPPGHHATWTDAMGFCFFNNAAIAAKAALARVDRVAILDWDVHHGNGTHDIFYESNEVFYASLHERDLYPGTGDLTQTGRGNGKGTTLNLPLPHGSDDAVYINAFESVVGPALSRFDPDLLLVSAGFDAHDRDPISRICVSTEGFGALVHRCRSLDVPLAFVLEGGYSLDALAESVGMVNEVFEGRVPVEPEGDSSEEARSVIERALEQLEL